MKTVVFYDGDPITMPPLLNLLRVLKHIGEAVTFVGIDWWDYREAVESIGVKCCVVHVVKHSYSIIHHPFKRIFATLFRRHLYEGQRNDIWRVIDEEMGSGADSVLWSCAMSSAARLGDRALKLGRRHVQTFFELGDESGVHIPGFDVESLYRNATLVECEINRAEILKALKGLERRPFVIPNCQFGLPTEANLPIRDKAAAEIVRAWKDKFVFLYQGGFVSDREGVVEVLETLCDAFPDDIVAAMLYYNELKCDTLLARRNFSLVPYVPAPRHLDVTSHASVGIAYYVPGKTVYSPLNAVYCAPNKIYEYAAFGIPTLGNDVPGLRYSVELAGAGVCFTSDGKDRIIEAAKRIKDNYSQYREAAKKFFDSVNLPGIVGEILASARNA